MILFSSYKAVIYPYLSNMQLTSSKENKNPKLLDHYRFCGKKGINKPNPLCTTCYHALFLLMV